MNALEWSSIGVCLSVLAWAEEVKTHETALRHELSMICGELGIPGATAAFVLRDGSFGEVAVGMADRERSQSMTTESRMPAASIGKTLVGACALALEADGLLDLDSPISTWMAEEPWFQHLSGHEQITARQLLTHCSGLPDHVYLASFREDVSRNWQKEKNIFTPEVLIGYILDHPLRFPPGEGWAYSDTGYVLLGVVIERATGKQVVEEVEKRFLTPCHLTSTHFLNQREAAGLVPGYTDAKNPFGFPVKSTDAKGRMHWHPGLENLGGGWLSTSGDLARWGDALFAGAALPEPARPRLLQTVPTSKEEDKTRYGFGVSYSPKGPLGPNWGHGGWIPGYISSLRHYKQHGITVAFQLNTDVVNAPEDENWMLEAEIRLARVLVKNQTPMEDLEHE